MSFLRKWRLKRRGDDGSTTYSSYSDDGSYTMTIWADGSKYVHGIVGVNMAKAFAGLRAVVEPGPVPEPDEPVRARTPMLELEPVAEPEPAPEPVNEQLHRDAKMLAKSVWLSGGGRKRTLNQGIPAQEDQLAFAVSQGWVVVSEDGVVTPGPTRPIDLMPEAEPLSARERRLRWGPGEPLW